MVKYDQQINVKVSKQIDEELDKYAEYTGIPKATKVRSLIIELYKKLLNDDEYQAWKAKRP